YEGEEKREKRFFEDRPYERKSYDKSSFNRSSDRRDSKYSRDRERDNKPPKKPYGFDSFKPARSREDSRDFFWNSEDLDYKKKED
ncbi:MAG: hypothetical protein HUK24_07075, partial [Sphaerochaetaceae bacterium]|nr:hypothetical protein [Sphaerochaetaceae bacterium]